MPSVSIEDFSHLLEKMATQNYTETHRFTSFLVKAGINAIKTSEVGVTVYFANMEKLIPFSEGQLEIFNGLFGYELLIKTKNFWLIMDDAWEYEFSCNTAARDLWEKYCREINPFILRATLDGEKV